MTLHLTLTSLLLILYLVWGVAIAGLALPEARVSWRVVGRAR